MACFDCTFIRFYFVYVETLLLCIDINNAVMSSGIDPFFHYEMPHLYI